MKAAILVMRFICSISFDGMYSVSAV